MELFITWFFPEQVVMGGRQREEEKGGWRGRRGVGERKDERKGEGERETETVIPRMTSHHFCHMLYVT
jgi:hypothetical protein